MSEIVNETFDTNLGKMVVVYRDYPSKSHELLFTPINEFCNGRYVQWKRWKALQ